MKFCKKSESVNLEHLGNGVFFETVSNGNFYFLPRDAERQGQEIFSVISLETGGEICVGRYVKVREIEFLKPQIVSTMLFRELSYGEPFMFAGDVLTGQNDLCVRLKDDGSQDVGFGRHLNIKRKDCYSASLNSVVVRAKEPVGWTYAGEEGSD